MANRFYSPNQQFCDATGAPYSGGTLAFYASGTSTPLNTYSDSALTIANTNPVVLDSSGRAGNIFLQNLAYKVVLSDVNSNPIWTDDPVYSSDYSTRAKLNSGSGSPNGNTAGTAGSASIGADTYWDTTNNILYVCTQTGTSSTAVWTAVNASTAAAVVPSPQGYLTPTSGTPVIASDVISASAVYYTPLVGNILPIYNGSSFVATTFSELQLTLVSQAASSIFDVFVFNNSGVLTLATGPAWSVSTAGSGARGTGAGTTQITRLNGLWVNSVSVSGKNGANTYTIPANQGTYLGSILIDSTPGQVTCHRSFGQSRKWGIWNAYNRKPIILQAGDGTSSWNYTTNVARPSNNSTANSLTVFAGLPEEIFDISFIQSIIAGTASATTQVIANWFVGIGWNSTSSFSGKRGIGGIRVDSGSIDSILQADSTAIYEAPPTIGINTVTSLEQTTAVSGTPSLLYQGQSLGMGLFAKWLG
jgi:hypothetical protein